MDGKIETIDLDRTAVWEVLDRVETTLGEEAAGPLRHLLEAYELILQLLSKKNASIQRLRKLVFGSKTEKRGKGTGSKGAKAGADPTEQGEDEESAGHGEEGPSDEGDAEGRGETRGGRDKGTGPGQQRKGHGRNGADQYTGAEWQFVPHDALAGGSDCPCCAGKVYEQREPARLVRLYGQAPIGATVYQLQRLRCNLCGKVFSADRPPEAGSETYDPSVAAMIALYRYGYGIPWNRIEQIQKQMGIPLPASTQWGLVEGLGTQFVPVEEELVRQGAQGDLLCNDDTTARILEQMRARAKREAFGEAEKSERTGTFTTSILSRREDGPPIALFRTGTAHAGENLEGLLSRRDPERDSPLQMCDGLERNLPKELATVVANCMAHGRRSFVEQEESFPEEVSYVLEELAVAYKVDEEAKKEGDSPQERLDRHRKESRPAMDRLHAWCREQIDEKKVEPNSGLGEAIRYMLKRWERLTRFLDVPGAPLDNNECEQALKKAILQRKNSLFYKTLHGAEVGDRFMSLIYTCMLNNVSPVDYLTTLARHTSEIARDPAAWMPWNYTAAIDAEPPPSGPG